MRHFNRLLLLFGIALTLAARASVHAATAPSSDEGNKLAEKFSFHGTQIETPEFKIAIKQLELAQNQRDAGLGTSEQLLGIQGNVENLRQHAPYQFSLQSNGGSLRELAARISMSGGFDFTIVNAAEPSDLETALPSFALRNVSWNTIVEVLDNFLAARRLQLRLAGWDNSRDLLASRSIICVLRRLDPPPGTQPPSSGFDSFQLTDYLSREQTVETIVDAIRTAWKMDPSRADSALQLKYHPATNLLFVSGPAPAVTISRQVISGLRRIDQKPVIH
jgi:hypothetical protein